MVIKSNKTKVSKKIDARYVAALLEDLRSQFKVFGEGLESVRRKSEDTFTVVGELQEQIGDVALKIEWLQSELKSVKIELGGIKKLLSRKADTERVEALEKRVAELEKLIAKALTK